MDFTPLVTALQKNDSATINKYTKALYPILRSYLRSNMRSSIPDAEDCIQDSLIAAYKAIGNGQLKDPTLLVAYVMSTCRNNYLNMQTKRGVNYVEEPSFDIFQVAPQMQLLLDKEKNRSLLSCFDQLQDKYKEFIKYWYDHPDMKTSKVASHFGISISNAWTRKHRIIKMLHDCHQREVNS